MTVGVLKATLHVPGARSLKDRRRVVRSAKDRLKNRFNVSVCELSADGRWHTAVLAVAAVGPDAAIVDERLRRVVSYLGREREAVLAATERECY